MSACCLLLLRQLLMRSLVTAHTTSLYVMPEVFNRASSVFLDSPVKRLCRNYLKCEFVILNEVKNLTKSITKSMRYKTEILRLGPQNDNCDTVSKPWNDENVVLLMNSLVTPYTQYSTCVIMASLLLKYY